MSYRFVPVLASTIFLFACGDDSGSMDAQGVPDAAVDASSVDASMADAGQDAAEADAQIEPRDAGTDTQDTGPTVMPKRLVIVHLPHGMVPERWTPSTTGRDFAFSDMIAPLEAIREDVTVVSGLDMILFDDDGGGRAPASHGYGIPALLTGVIGTEGESPTTARWFQGGRSSLDTLAADPSTPFDVVFLFTGTTNRFGFPYQLISWNGANDPREPMQPPEAYARVFGEMPMIPSDVAALEARALPYDDDVLPVIDVQFDLASAALRHGRTRAVTIQAGTDSTQAQFPSFGYADTWHEVTHSSRDPEGEARLVEIWAYFAGQILDLANELRAVPEGEGNMLDNTLIVWTSETGVAGSHRSTDIPVVLIGNLDGAIDSGQHVSVEDRYHTDLLLTLAQLFDPTLTSFGDPDQTTGPITEILN